jgi:environmental stress-induced protein Ves
VYVGAQASGVRDALFAAEQKVTAAGWQKPFDLGLKTRLRVSFTRARKRRARARAPARHDTRLAVVVLLFS